MKSLIKSNILIITLMILMVLVPLEHAFNITLNNLSTMPSKSKIEVKKEVLPLEFAPTEQLPTLDIEEPSRGYTREVEVLSNSSTKTYMNYKMITDTSSPQYQYIYNSGEVMICDDGFIRTIDQIYLGVALGSYFGNIGSKWIFTLDDGTELKVVKVEAKADEHTCENNFMQKWDKSVIEFVVDVDKMDYARAENSYLYSGNFNNNEWLKGEIVKIEEIIK